MTSPPPNGCPKGGAVFASPQPIQDGILNRPRPGATLGVIAKQLQAEFRPRRGHLACKVVSRPDCRSERRTRKASEFVDDRFRRNDPQIDPLEEQFTGRHAALAASL